MKRERWACIQPGLPEIKGDSVDVKCRVYASDGETAQRAVDDLAERTGAQVGPLVEEGALQHERKRNDSKPFGLSGVDWESSSCQWVPSGSAWTSRKPLHN